MYVYVYVYLIVFVLGMQDIFDNGNYNSQKVT